MAASEGPSQQGCLEIGRISKIRKDIDPGGTITNFLRSKMSIIDLVPCLFTVDYSSLLTVVDNKIKTNFAPTLDYQKAITDYMSSCATYGLEPYEFVRLNLTDMTSVSDDMSNEYSKSVIDDAFNSLTTSRLGQIFQKGYRSAESAGVGEKIDKYVNDISGFISEIAEVDVTPAIDLARNVLTHGSRISFPKIWSNSTYSPNLSCNIKLVSPYGHPKAINKFIIEPLCYLIILLSPSTSDGLITHKPRFLTMKSYGLSNLSLCYPATLNIRRGGDDSSYSRYCQPLSIDVAITFNAVTEGFACYKDEVENDDSPHPEMGMLLGDESIALKDFRDDFDQPQAMFPTLKSIVNSFRPYNFTQSTATSTTTKTTTLPFPTTSSSVSGGVIGEIPSDVLNVSPAIIASESALLIVPPIISETTNSIVVSSTQTTSPIYEAQIVSDTSNTESYEINTSDFESNDILTSSTTENIDGVYKTTLFYPPSQETQNLRLRNTTSINTPGIWSETIIINRSPSDTNLKKISVDIIPSYKNYTSNLKWQLIQNNEVKYGPFSAFNENEKYVDANNYLLQIIDQDNNILQEMNTEVNNSVEVEIIIDESYGSITTIFDIPSNLDIGDFSYYLISDFTDTILIDCYTNELYEYPEGKHYYLVKYKNEIITKLTPDIDNSIIVQNNTLINKTIKIESVNNHLVITSIV